jgi:hypothetical protein
MIITQTKQAAAGSISQQVGAQLGGIATQIKTLLESGRPETLKANGFPDLTPEDITAAMGEDQVKKYTGIIAILEGTATATPITPAPASA